MSNPKMSCADGRFYAIATAELVGVFSFSYAIAYQGDWLAAALVALAACVGFCAMVTVLSVGYLVWAISRCVTDSRFQTNGAIDV